MSATAFLQAQRSSESLREWPGGQAGGMEEGDCSRGQARLVQDSFSVGGCKDEWERKGRQVTTGGGQPPRMMKMTKVSIPFFVPLLILPTPLWPG